MIFLDTIYYLLGLVDILKREDSPKDQRDGGSLNRIYN